MIVIASGMCGLCIEYIRILFICLVRCARNIGDDV